VKISDSICTLMGAFLEYKLIPCRFRSYTVDGKFPEIEVKIQVFSILHSFCTYLLLNDAYQII